MAVGDVDEPLDAHADDDGAMADASMFPRMRPGFPTAATSYGGPLRSGMSIVPEAESAPRPRFGVDPSPSLVHAAEPVTMSANAALKRRPRRAAAQPRA